MTNFLSVDKNSAELLDRFLRLRRGIYRHEYAAYAETESHRGLIDYYDHRPDYDLRLLLGNDGEAGDVARLLVGRCDAYPFAFFGFFECRNRFDDFSALMDRACEVAREMGARELFGPIELNALHGWMFLDRRSSSHRWIGDPLHLDHYPQLFRRAGWRVADQAVSGIFYPGAHGLLIEELPSLIARAEARGIVIKTLEDVSSDDALGDLWRVGRESFTPELNRAVPIDEEMLARQMRPVLASLRDPRSLVLLYKDDVCAGYSLSIENFIDRLVNPDGQKTPGPGACRPSPLSIKSMAVSRNFQGQGLFKLLLAVCADHCDRNYRHALAWRRTLLNNPGTPFMFTNAEITETYVTFRRPLT